MGACAGVEHRRRAEDGGGSRTWPGTGWPSTANPHLLVNQHSANGTGSAGIGHLYKTVFRGKAATLERLRVDRQFQEALAAGPDPLHLASLFGLDPKTAIRYAESARQLLVTAAEEQDPALPAAFADTTASKVALVGLHLVAAAIIVPVLARHAG